MLTAASLIMKPFREIGANFSLQLPSRTQFAKISKKKLSPKINVKNIKKLDFKAVQIATYQRRVYVLFLNTDFYYNDFRLYRP